MKIQGHANERDFFVVTARIGHVHARLFQPERNIANRFISNCFRSQHFLLDMCPDLSVGCPAISELDFQSGQRISRFASNFFSLFPQKYEQMPPILAARISGGNSFASKCGRKACLPDCSLLMEETVMFCRFSHLVACSLPVFSFSGTLLAQSHPTNDLRARALAVRSLTAPTRDSAISDVRLAANITSVDVLRHWL